MRGGGQWVRALVALTLLIGLWPDGAEAAEPSASDTAVISETDGVVDPALIERARAQQEAPESPLPIDVEDPTPTPPGEGGVRTLTVTPDTDLVHGQTVTVQGEGWPARRWLYPAQCVQGVPTYEGCELFGPDEFRTSAQGRFTFTAPVEVFVDATEGDSYDCRVEVCLVAVAGDGPATSPRFAELQFDPTGPDPVRRVVAVTPDTGLVDGQQVTVTGDGFPIFDPEFGGIALLTMCRAPVSSLDDCDDGATEYVWLEESGHLERPFRVSAILALGDGTTHDCRTGSCALLVRNDDFFGGEDLSEAGLAPLAFDPGGAIRPAPTLVVDPATGLRDGDAVEITAQFDPNRVFTILQCVAGATSSEDCEAGVIRFGFTDETGEIGGFMPVRARFRSGNGDLVDCRVTACSIVIAHGNLGRHAEAVLAFDPSAPLLEPTIEVTPSTGLHDRDLVTVRGTGFPSASLLEAAQCPAGERFLFFDCDFENLVEVPTEAAQSLELAPTEAAVLTEAAAPVEFDFQVRARFETDFGPPVDCRTQACDLVLTDFGNAYVAAASLSFAVRPGPDPGSAPGPGPGAAPGPIAATPTFTG